ncbi:MAG: crossover junction endodeoxyribonuclease RuvC [bacterium]|nr:crossover junction endodeoxyribonuclease RuvC [bacterium]
MKVLGIDPGIERLGWAVVDGDRKKFNYINSGVKKTLKTDSEEKRLLQIHDFLEELIAKERPECVTLEKVFFSKNVKTALVIGEVRGIILMLAAKHGAKVIQLGPGEIKLAIAGYGKADKKSVFAMLTLTLALPDKKILDDESDAIAIACSGVIHSTSLQLS